MAPSSNILEVFMRILRVLECPVCYEWASRPIYGCSAGHILCAKCIPALRECPTCRSPIRLTSPRVRSLEDIAEMMLYPCRHEGCTQLLAQSDLTRHEETCPHAAASGGAALPAGLKHSNLLNSLLAHMEEHIAPFLVTSKNTADKVTQTEETNDSQSNLMSGPFFISGVIQPISSLGNTTADHNLSNLNQVCGVLSTLNEIADNNQGTDFNSECLQKGLSKIMQSLSSMDLSPKSSGRKEVGNPSTKNAVINSASDCLSKNCVTSVSSKFVKKPFWEFDSSKRRIVVPTRITNTSGKVLKSNAIFFTKGTSTGNVEVSRSRGDSSSQDSAGTSLKSASRPTSDAAASKLKNVCPDGAGTSFVSAKSEAVAPEASGGSSNRNGAGTSSYSALRQTYDDIASLSRGHSASQDGAGSSSALRLTSGAVALEPREGSSSQDNAGTSSLSAARQTCDNIASLSRGDSASQDGAGSSSVSALRQTSDAVAPEPREGCSSQDSAGTSSLSAARQTCDDIASLSRGDSSSQDGVGSSCLSASHKKSDAAAEPKEGCSNQDGAGRSFLPADHSRGDSTTAPQPRESQSSSQNVASPLISFQFHRRNYFSSPSPPVAFTIGANPKSPTEMRTPRMRDRKYTFIRNSGLSSYSRTFRFPSESSLSDGFNFSSSSNANLSPLSSPVDSVPTKKSPVKRLFSFGDVSFDSSPDVLN